MWIGSTAVNVGGTHINVGGLTSPDSSITFGYSSPNITAVVNTALLTDLHVAKLIVNSAGTAGTGANYSTIVSAMTAAASGDTIFIMPGVYTENFTWKSGVNITAFDCDALTPNVTILGKITATFSGSASMSGIRLKTNSDYCLEVTGSSATVLNFKNCFIQVNNNTAIHYTSSSGGSRISFYQCSADIDTTGIAYFTHTGSGGIAIEDCKFENAGGTVTPSTITNNTGGAIGIRNGYFNNSITSSGSGATVSLFNIEYHGDLIVNSTVASGNLISKSYLFSAAIGDSALTLGAGSILTLTLSEVFSNNTNAIAGSGTLNLSGIVFTGSSSTIQGTITQNALVFIPSGSSSTPVNWSVKLSANQSNVTGNGTQYKIPFDTVDFDSASAYNTGTKIYTVPSTGIYNLIRSDFLFGGSAITTILLGWYSINGAAFPGIRVVDNNPASLGLGVGGEFILSTSTLVSLNAGDTIEVYIDANGSGSDNVGVGGGAASAFFSGFKVS